jgi:hypothetical protein
MNYRKVYDAIIAHAKNQNRKKSIEYYYDENYKKHQRSIAPFYEGHHIIPKSLGGEGKSNCWNHANIIPLTPREHFFCHQLLTKIYPGRETAYALWCMISFRDFKLTSKEYERLKIKIYEYRKENKKGNARIAKSKMKRVLCVDTGEIFESIDMASHKYNINRSSISMAATGRFFEAGGKTWRLIGDDNNIIEPKYKKEHTSKCIKVKCITTNELFNSLKEAEDKYGVNHVAIAKAAKGIYYHAGKLNNKELLWRYIDNCNNIIEYPGMKSDKRSSKKVICITTGEIFDSLKAAGDKYDRCPVNIGTAASGKTRSCGQLNEIPLVWRYLDESNNVIDVKCKCTRITKRKIKCITTGEIFQTITEAAKA